MNKKANLETAKSLDQFYTNPVFAEYFFNDINRIIDRTQFDIELEPSAGTGSFYNLLDPTKRIGLDLDPKTPGVNKINFFDWSHPTDKKIITVGNPPFGKNSGLAIKFFNHAAKFSNVIAFVLPRTFRKVSVINRLNLDFHCIYDQIVPDSSFIFNNEPYDVWCCAQIWIRKSVKREKVKPHKLSDYTSWFKLVDPHEADFSIQRVGGRAGMIRTSNFQQFSTESHYFFKISNQQVLKAFQQINFDEVKFNTVGNPSISPNELIELWLIEARKLGLLTDNNKNQFLIY